MKLDDALAIHAQAYKALGIADGIPESRRGSVFIGLAIGVLFSKLHPKKATKLLDAMTLMRNEVIGDDHLWTDLINALAFAIDGYDGSERRVKDDPDTPQQEPDLDVNGRMGSGDGEADDIATRLALQDFVERTRLTKEPDRDAAVSTRAGQELLERESLNSRSFSLITPEAIAAIEAEVRADIAAKVAALPDWPGPDVMEPDAVDRAAVLALLTGPSDSEQLAGERHAG